MPQRPFMFQRSCNDADRNLEILLPLLTEVEIEFPEQPFLFFASSSSSKDEKEDHQCSPRFNVFSGEKVSIKLKLIPKLINEWSEVKKVDKNIQEKVQLFRSVFNIKEGFSLENKQKFIQKCLKAWKRTFSQLYIHIYIADSLHPPNLKALDSYKSVGSFINSTSSMLRRYTSPLSFKIDIRRVINTNQDQQEQQQQQQQQQEQEQQKKQQQKQQQQQKSNDQDKEGDNESGCNDELNSNISGNMKNQFPPVYERGRSSSSVSTAELQKNEDEILQEEDNGFIDSYVYRTDNLIKQTLDAASQFSLVHAEEEIQQDIKGKGVQDDDGGSNVKQQVNNQAIGIQEVKQEENSEEIKYGEDSCLEFYLNTTIPKSSEKSCYLVITMNIASDRFTKFMLEQNEVVGHDSMSSLPMFEEEEEEDDDDDNNDNGYFKIEGGQSSNVDNQNSLLLSGAIIPTDLTTKIFLASIYKPVLIAEPLRVYSKSKLFSNMKNLIQLTIENTHPRYTITVHDIRFHLATSAIALFEHFNQNTSEYVKELLTSTSSSIQIDEKRKRLIDSGDFLSAHNLFQYFVDRSSIPIELKPLEQFTLIFIIYPKDRNFIEGDNNIGTQVSALGSSGSFNTNTFRRTLSGSSVASSKYHNRSSSGGNSSSQISDNQNGRKYLLEAKNLGMSGGTENICMFETLVDVKYEVHGISSQLSKEHGVQWNAVLKRGLFVALKYNPIFIRSNENNSMFNITVGISNFTPSYVNLILCINTSPSSGIICHDAQIEIGKIATLDSREVQLRFTAVQEGFHTISELYFHNSITKQNFVFPFACQIYVKKQPLLELAETK